MADLDSVLHASGGLLTHNQALHCGFTREQVHARVRRGEWVPLHREVYLVGRARLTPVARARASWWAAGTGVVCGPLAALVHGIDLHRVPVRPEVLLPPGLARTQRRTLHYRWGAVRPDEVVVVRGVPVTGPVRTLQDLAQRHGPTTSTWALEHALRHGIVRHEDLGGGTRRWLRVVAAAEPASDSPLETGGRLELRAAGFEVLCQQRVLDPERGSYVVVDLLVLGRDGLPPVAVEADGGAHARPLTIAQDRHKQHVLQAAGLRVVRYTWPDLDDRPGWLPRQVHAVQHAGAAPATLRRPAA